MTIVHHPDLIQGSDEWFAARCGLLTASEMNRIITPTFKVASNDKERTHLYELLAQRITRYVEPHFVGDDMLRGQQDEVEARLLYAKHYAPVQEMGFITNDKWGFTLGYSPDGLVGEGGLIECKSRRQKFQIATVVENAAKGTIPAEFVLQIQTGLLVSERAWCDFCSYSGGLPMITIRAFPDPEVHDAILGAATEFEQRLAKRWSVYRDTIASWARSVPTERRIEQDILV